MIYSAEGKIRGEGCMAGKSHQSLMINMKCNYSCNFQYIIFQYSIILILYMKKIIFLLLLVSIAVYFFYPERVITFPAGITAPGQPEQIRLNEEKKWTSGEYTIEALASYKIIARVLSRNNFYMGQESDLSPFDLALGWGPMSDQSIIDRINISQSNRWYRWQADVLPLPAADIIRNSANVHILPKDKIIKEKFDEVYKGTLIEMEGYLVKITADGGWKWISSLRRDDTGGGSCEILWVEEVTVINK
jgi:hypothetical protein